VFDFLDKQIRDASFYQKYRGFEENRKEHVSYFEEIVGIQIEDYKKKNKVQFYIGRENIRLIRRNVRMLLAWKYLRSRNFEIMDGNKIADCIIHVIWFIFDREDRPNKEDLSYNTIREFCKSNAIVKLRQLPENYQKLPQDMIKAAPHPIPIQDRSTIRDIVSFLRKSYNVDKLPDSYFVQRPALPEKWQDLRLEVRNEFPIKDIHRLTTLNSIRYNLKRFYLVPTRLPENYFNLPVRENQPYLFKPALPTNPADISLDCEKYLPWKRGGTEDYSFLDLLKDLHAKYSFLQLPENYFFQRTPLPKFPGTIKFPDDITVPATTVQDARRLSRYLFPLYNYEIPLDKNWINLEADKRSPLPSSMEEANVGAGTNFPVYRTNLLTQVRMLRKQYKFYKIPEEWIKSTFIQKPELPNIQTVVTELSSKRGKMMELPIKDRNKFKEVINNLRTFYSFRTLPEEFMDFSQLPVPEFPGVGNLVFE
jgi:hypothetical protein